MHAQLLALSKVYNIFIMPMCWVSS
jgi:hypothetical protein